MSVVQTVRDAAGSVESPGPRPVRSHGMDTAQFAGRVVLVTGGGSGIGRATARRFAALGARVRIGDRDAAAMADTCTAHPNLSAAHLDVTEETSVGAFVDGAVAELGVPDVLVNLAGVLTFANSHRLATADWHRVLDVNLTGTFLMCRQVIGVMLDADDRDRDRDRVIVNTASTAAHLGQAWAAAYGASKGGVLALTRALAVEYGRRGIRVNSVSPGSVTTPMIEGFAFPDGADESLLARTMPLAGMGTPEQVAAAITYLASDDAAFVMGADLRIDGATTA